MWIVTDPGAEAGALETLPETPGATLLTRRALKVETGLRFGPDERVCATSESVLDLVMARMDDPARRDAVAALKDKARFRRLLAPLFPDYRFREVALSELPSLRLAPGEKVVAKPMKGCFGTGVRVLDARSDLPGVAAEIAREVGRNAAVLSASVLTPDAFLLESYVEGEEHAVDMFYDGEGRAVVTGIYHHPMPRNPAYLHMAYYTSAGLFRRLLEPAREFFTRLNETLRVRALPVHAEFRAQGERLFPIEMNPLRFGGMGLGNLGAIALGVNPYACFAVDAAPDWERVWAGRGETAYAYVIGYNGATVDVATHEPDRARFRGLFPRVLREVPLDHRAQLAFGIYFVEEPDPARIPALLETEFDDFFVPSAPAAAAPAQGEPAAAEVARTAPRG